MTSDHDFATEEVRKPRRLQGRHHAKPSFSMVSDCGKGLRQFCADRRNIYSYPQNGTIMLKCPLLLDFEVSALHHAFHAEAAAVPLATMHAASTRHIGYWLSWPPGYAELGLPPDLAHLRASPAAAQPPQSMRCVLFFRELTLDTGGCLCHSTALDMHRRRLGWGQLLGRRCLCFMLVLS